MEGPRHQKPREKSPDPNPKLVIDRGDHYEYHYEGHVDFVSRDKKKVLGSNSAVDVVFDAEGKAHSMGKC